MERLKQKKSNTSQIHYPAPYTKTWVGVVNQRNMEKATSGVKMNQRYSQQPLKQGSQLSYNGPDPTVPHLKYGLFPRKIYFNRGPSRTLNTKKPSIRTVSPLTDIRKERTEFPRTIKKINNYEKPKHYADRSAQEKTSTQKFLEKSKAQGSLSAAAAPTLVFRPLERCNFRSLTVSASTHLDIKPRPPRAPARAPRPCTARRLQDTSCIEVPGVDRKQRTNNSMDWSSQYRQRRKSMRQR